MVWAPLEVAELGFPAHQSRRVCERIAIFEAENAELGQRTVANLEAAALDRIEGDIFLATFLIDPHCVALAERAAAAILPGQTDVVALRQQGAEGERFGR